MDPLTQGITGIIAGQSAAGRERIREATLAGLIGGILPDADVLIHVPGDPLFNLMIHRHFTHSLIFIPIGGLLAAFLAWLLMRREPNFWRIYLFAALGYATGGLLDACTSYGTHLYWPFSGHRTAWDAIAIIDPLFTLILALACFSAFRKKTRAIALIGLVLGLSYLGTGFYARHAATDVLLDAAQKRGHTVCRIRLMPTLGNLILWRGVYETPGSGDTAAFHVNAVRLGIFKEHRLYPGPTVQKFTPEGLTPNPISQQILFDIRRFSRFADGYIFQFQKSPLIIGDLRYAMLPQQSEPLWGLVIPPAHQGRRTQLKYFDRLDAKTFRDFRQMLAGADL